MIDTEIKRCLKRSSNLTSFLRAALVGAALFITALPTQAKHADLIIYGDYLLTMQADQSVLEDAAVAIVGDKIVAVGPRAEINREFIASKVIEGKGKVLMPGLINGHTHSAMTLFRGMVDDLDLWEEVRMAALLHKLNTGDPTALPARQALSMATRIGAKAIHMGDEIGQLTVGRQADLIQLSFNETRHLPLYDVVSHLVYVLDSSDVVTTVVAGEVLMEDRKVLTIDEAKLRQNVGKKSAEIRAALKQPEQTVQD